MNNLDRYTELNYRYIKLLSGVYIIQNKIDNKKYIGETKTLGKRIKTHLQELLDNRHVNIHLQNAVNKYGIENFRFDVIELCETWETKRREHHWATVLYAHDDKHGYNIQPTDPEGNRICSEETKKKISKANSGRKMTPQRAEENRNREYKQEWREAIKEGLRTGKPRIFTIEERENKRIFFTGRKHSEETKQKISKVHKGKIISEEQIQINKKLMTDRYGKPVIMLTKEGKCVEEFSSCKEAAKKLNVQKGSISTSIKNNGTVKGFVFIRKNNYSEYEVIKRLQIIQNKKIKRGISISRARKGCKLSAEICEQMSISRKGKKWSEETKEKAKLKRLNNSKYIHTQETKNKISEKAKGRYKNKSFLFEKIEKYDLVGNKLIEFSTIGLAAKHMNANNSTFCKMIKRNNNCYKNFIWKCIPYGNRG